MKKKEINMKKEIIMDEPINAVFSLKETTSNDKNEVIWHRDDFKFEILNEEHPDFPGCYRIRATKAFGPIKKGQLGGFIKDPENLGHDDLSWVYKGSVVTDINAHIRGQVFIKDSIINGPVMIHGDEDDLSDGGVHVKGSIINGNISIDGYSIFVTDTTVTNRGRQTSQFGGFIVMKTCRIFGECFLFSPKEAFMMTGVAGQIAIPECVTDTLDSYVEFTGDFSGKPDFKSMIPNRNLDLQELTKLNWR